MLSLLFLRCVCELIFLFNLFEPILNAPIGSILAETIGFEEGQCQHTTTTTGMTGIGGTTSMMHTPTSSAASSSSGVWKSAASLNEPDALTWLKLLFVPALGLLLLAALLEELCFASGSPQPTTLFGWFRQFCSRGPKLTTAYANQLKQNSLGLVGLHHTHSNGTCTCGHGANGLTNSHGSASLAVGMPSASSASGGLLLNDSNASPFAPLSLQLNFNGFNQLSGPLQYYNTFTREECDTIDTSSPKVMNGKHSTTTSPTSLAKRKDAPLSPNSSSPSASPSTPTLSTFSFSSPSSLTPPSSDFVPLTLVNESTGFSQTFSLWKHLTFGEILAYYIDNHWSDEKCKYDSAEYIHDDIPTDGPTSLTALATGTTNPTNTNTNASPTDGSNRTFSTPPLMLQYEGTRLSSLLTPASVFPSSSSSSSSSPSSIPRLTISTDYFLLFDRHRHRMNNQVAEKKAKFHRQELTRQEISERIHRLEDEAQTKQKAHKEVTDKLSVLSTELKKITKELDRLTKELDTLQKDRHEVQQSIGSSVGLIRNLKLRLQEEYSTLKASHDTRSTEYQQCKEKYSQGIEERHRLSNELKSSMIRYDTLSKRSNQLKQQKSKHEKLVEKIKKLEQVLAGVEGPIASSSSTTTNSDSKKDSSTISTTSSSTSSSASTSPSTSTSSLSSTSTAAQLDPLQAAARMKARYDQLEQEHNVLNVQLNELRLTSHEIDDLSKNEHYKLRYRLKLFEKDARDLQKWKSLARASEMDARQAIQWKMALRKLKQQEREWEKDEKEYHHWRRRARMIEKEVRDLRQWKARHLNDGLNDATVGAIGGVGVGVGVSTLLHSLQPPPPSASAPPGFEPRNTAATGQLEDTRRRAHSLTNENELLHGIGVGLGVSSSIVSPPSADLDGLFASAGVVGSSGFASFRSSLHSSRVTSGSGIVSDELNFGVIPSVDGAFDVDLPDDSDEEDFAHHSHAYGNFGSHASWNFSPATTSFDSHLLNSRTPNMRPRDQLRSTSPNRVGNVGSDIAAAASEHEPDFTHTLPAFLAE